jgi:hypothetical protein
VDSSGIRPSRSVQMQSLLLLSSLNSCVAVLCNLLLSGVPNQCHSLHTLPFASIFCIISIGQLHALRISVCSGVQLQPVHCIVSFKDCCFNISLGFQGNV